MVRSIFLLWAILVYAKSFGWGFYAHAKINYQAVFSLPPELLAFYKQHQDYLKIHATDPDKRRYAVVEEGPRHYIDIDYYGTYPFYTLPRRWEEAISVYSEDTLQRYGIVPWYIGIMQARLTKAFMEKDVLRILQVSAELGHYIADAHVPLHASSNHNGQLTGQQGIHGFWESRIPELLADQSFSFWVGKAFYISNVSTFIWERVLESAQAADTVLHVERVLNDQTSPAKKYAYEERNGVWVKQYSRAYSLAYNDALHGMIERRMQASIRSVSSFWYTAWINAGQPSLPLTSIPTWSSNDSQNWLPMNKAWLNGISSPGIGCE